MPTPKSKYPHTSMTAEAREERRRFGEALLAIDPAAQDALAVAIQRIYSTHVAELLALGPGSSKRNVEYLRGMIHGISRVGTEFTRCKRIALEERKKAEEGVQEGASDREARAKDALRRHIATATTGVPR
jgi:hypothetical protein